MRRIFALITAVLLCLAIPGAHAEETVPKDKNAALKLIRHLYQGESQNTLVFSPFSLNIALSMAAEGADGETLRQLNQFLGSRPDPMLIEDLRFSGVEIANAAFLRPDFQLLAGYQDALSGKYEADALPMEMGGIMNQVNEWVYKHTDGLIDDLLDREPGAETAMLLINALSLKAEWASPFDPVNTGFAVFHAPAGDIEVSSMRQTAAFRYTETDGVQSVALPYRNSPLEMIVILPSDSTLQTLSDELSDSPDAFLSKYIPAESTLVQLSLPNVHAESSFELKDALLALNVTDAFSADAADFSRMAENALDMDLHIGSILQKAVLKVNETGTEAAAATQVAMLTRGAYIAETAIMNVDKPFMMLIHDPASGCVLFAALINNPA